MHYHCYQYFSAHDLLLLICKKEKLLSKNIEISQNFEDFQNFDIDFENIHLYWYWYWYCKLEKFWYWYWYWYWTGNSRNIVIDIEPQILISNNSGPRGARPLDQWKQVCFVSLVLDGVLIISVVLEAIYALRLRALKGCCVSSKSPAKVRDRD